MGGGEGEGDAMGAVMVDTGSAAQEWLPKLNNPGAISHIVRASC